MLIKAVRFDDLPDGTIIANLQSMKCSGGPPYRAIAWRKDSSALAIEDIVESDFKEVAARHIALRMAAKRVRVVCPIEEGECIRYLEPDAITLQEAIVASYGIAVRRDDPPKLKVLGSGDTAINREGAEELRQRIIVLRDGALEQNDFEWAVTLSHTIAFMANAIEEIWPQ